jgi:hypothetical protein
MDAIKRCSECTVSVLYKRKACVSQCCGLYRVIPVQAKDLCYIMLRISAHRLFIHVVLLLLLFSAASPGKCCERNRNTEIVFPLLTRSNFHLNRRLESISVDTTPLSNSCSMSWAQLHNSKLHLLACCRVKVVEIGEVWLYSM